MTYKAVPGPKVISITGGNHSTVGPERRDELPQALPLQRQHIRQLPAHGGGREEYAGLCRDQVAQTAVDAQSGPQGIAQQQFFGPRQLCLGELRALQSGEYVQPSGLYAEHACQLGEFLAYLPLHRPDHLG